jgi:hypothetical protein
MIKRINRNEGRTLMKQIYDIKEKRQMKKNAAKKNWKQKLKTKAEDRL